MWKIAFTTSLGSNLVCTGSNGDAPLVKETIPSGAKWHIHCVDKLLFSLEPLVFHRGLTVSLSMINLKYDESKAVAAGARRDVPFWNNNNNVHADSSEPLTKECVCGYGQEGNSRQSVNLFMG